MTSQRVKNKKYDTRRSRLFGCVSSNRSRSTTNENAHRRHVMLYIKRNSLTIISYNKAYFKRRIYHVNQIHVCRI